MTQAQINGITIEYETQGSPSGAPLLLIMGLGAQMTRWPPALIDKLTAKGFYVIRFDNRDAGLSQKFQGTPTIEGVVGQIMQGKKPDIPYTMDDMAADAIGVLDHLAIQRAHLVGASMGGMIGQLVAANYPERVLSFTAIFTTTGNPSLPQATPEAMAVLTTPAPDPRKDIEAYLDQAVKNAHALGSPSYRPDPRLLRERLRADVLRAYEPLGVARQIAAVVVSGDRRAIAATIKAPTVVLHGEADPLIRVEGGRDLAATIPGAELRVIPGMGHDLPAALYDEVVSAISRAAERANVPA